MTETKGISTQDPHDLIKGPNDIDGYASVGWTLMKKDLNEAFLIIEEGVLNNPESFQLHGIKGQCLFKKAREISNDALSNPTPESQRLLIQALQSYRQAANLGLRQRSTTSINSWTNFLDNDLRAAARMATMIELKYGNPDQAHIFGTRFSEAVGGDPIVDKNLEKAKLN